MTLTSFLPALIGGILIGTAASLLLWLNGRLAGISGILWRSFFAKPGDALWRVLFLIGVVAGAALYYGMFNDAPVAREHFPAWLLILSGLLVGYGTSLGNGCTSGHGVCGLGRLSLRSLVATVIFLSVAIVTTFMVRHIFGVLS
ncbi:MAG: YeeE/YedE family protein [Sideroxydans sp.]|nr:YeeE/YedE family protein [Sideroxydans sp.]NOT99291.1 YeeE/YedE family protein [Sideroxydans sp.]